jgi:hypothetical protein
MRVFRFKAVREIAFQLQKTVIRMRLEALKIFSLGVNMASVLLRRTPSIRLTTFVP